MSAVMSEAERAADRRLAEKREAGRRIAVTTPEGITLHFTIAGAGDRVNAFILDSVIIMALVIACFLAVIFTLGNDIAVAFALLASFLIRNFYFTFFELRWQGATPGKRKVGIRVVDGKGGPLSAEQIVTRNLTRDVETFIPLVVLVFPEQLWPGAPGWARFVSSIWLLLFMLLPLFNKHRLRIGDLVAGTMVVMAPKSMLLDDLSAGASLKKGPISERGYRFTDEQLDVYGIFELQVLEAVLRDSRSSEGRKALEIVCDKVKRKIGWDAGRWGVDPERFLRDFYAAQRARLENRLLFGKRKEDKFAK